MTATDAEHVHVGRATVALVARLDSIAPLAAGQRRTVHAP